MTQSICVFGDSVAKGVVFDALKNKYLLLKDCFVNQVQNAAHLVVKNYAKFGCTVTKGKEILQKHLSDVSHYDYTVLEFGGNDCDYDWAAVSNDPNVFHSPNTPVGHFESVYGEMIAKVKESGGKPVLLSLPPIDAQKYFTWISRGLNAKNILNFLGDAEHIYRWHEMYNLAVYHLSILHDVPIIDITSSFLEKMNYKELICEDGIHPSEKGHTLIAAEIEAYVSQKEKDFSSLMLAAI